MWNAHVFAKLPYDPDRDLKPITRLFFLLESVLARTTLPVGSLKGLQAMASAKPGSLNAGTLGPGSQPDEFAAYLRAQREMAGQLARKYNIPKQ